MPKIQRNACTSGPTAQRVELMKHSSVVIFSRYFGVSVGRRSDHDLNLDA